MLEPLQQQIRQTQQPLSKAQGIAYDVQAIEAGEFARNYSPVLAGLVRSATWFAARSGPLAHQRRR